MKNGEETDSSSDDSGVDETDDDLRRSKRSDGIEWCGVEDEAPPSTSSQYNSGNIFYGNPKLGNRMQLFSRTNHFVAVYSDRTVRGTQDSDDLHTHLEVTNAGQPGHVRLRGILTRLFVAMNKNGRLYGEHNAWREATVFIESFQGQYNTYLSRANAHLGWYLGIKKSGKGKKGSKTSHRQKAVLFLPVRKKFE